jgi:hypothetical protein
MEDPDADTLASSPKPNAASSMHLHAEIGSSMHGKPDIFVGMKK